MLEDDVGARTCVAVFFDDGLDAEAVSGLVLFLPTDEVAVAPSLAWVLLEDGGGAGPLAGAGAAAVGATEAVAGAVAAGTGGAGAIGAGAEADAAAVSGVDVGAVMSAASGMSIAGVSKPTCPPSPAAAAEATCCMKSETDAGAVWLANGTGSEGGGDGGRAAGVESSPSSSSKAALGISKVVCRGK